MKYWMILVIFLTGFMLSIVGALFKIMHLLFANLLLTISMGIQVLAILLLIVKIVRNKEKGFLNK